MNTEHTHGARKSSFKNFASTGTEFFVAMGFKISHALSNAALSISFAEMVSRIFASTDFAEPFFRDSVRI